MVSSSLTFEPARFKALRANTPWFRPFSNLGEPDAREVLRRQRQPRMPASGQINEAITIPVRRKMMERIAEFLFEALLLKRVQRTGYQFLGPGKESVAEHTFGVMCIAWTLAQLVPEADQGRLLVMCLVHDLPEARLGDLNAVQKQYVAADEKRAVADMTRGLPFGASIDSLLDEFNTGDTLEAQLASDADQLAFLLDLKSLADMGYTRPGQVGPTCQSAPADRSRHPAVRAHFQH
jgi:putative hydrolase of HD superfamily